MSLKCYPKLNVWMTQFMEGYSAKKSQFTMIFFPSEVNNTQFSLKLNKGMAVQSPS